MSTHPALVDLPDEIAKLVAYYHDLMVNSTMKARGAGDRGNYAEAAAAITAADESSVVKQEARRIADLVDSGADPVAILADMVAATYELTNGTTDSPTGALLGIHAYNRALIAKLAGLYSTISGLITSEALASPASPSEIADGPVGSLHGESRTARAVGPQRWVSCAITIPTTGTYIVTGEGTPTEDTDPARAFKVLKNGAVADDAGTGVEAGVACPCLAGDVFAISTNGAWAELRLTAAEYPGGPVDIEQLNTKTA